MLHWCNLSLYHAKYAFLTFDYNFFFSVVLQYLVRWDCYEFKATCPNLLYFSEKKAQNLKLLPSKLQSIARC